MAGDLAEYVRAGYLLSPEQRLEAALLLRLSVDHDEQADQTAIDAAWKAEISSRIEEINRGEVGLLDADETYRFCPPSLPSSERDTTPARASRRPR